MRVVAIERELPPADPLVDPRWSAEFSATPAFGSLKPGRVGTHRPRAGGRSRQTALQLTIINIVVNQAASLNRYAIPSRPVAQQEAPCPYVGIDVHARWS